MDHLCLLEWRRELIRLLLAHAEIRPCAFATARVLPQAIVMRLLRRIHVLGLREEVFGLPIILLVNYDEVHPMCVLLQIASFFLPRFFGASATTFRGCVVIPLAL